MNEEISKMEFAFFIKHHRKTAGLTQAKMAENLGVTVNILHRWENMKARPRDMHALLVSVRNTTKLEIKRKRGW